MNTKHLGTLKSTYSRFGLPKSKYFAVLHNPGPFLTLLAWEYLASRRSSHDVLKRS